MNKPHFYMLVGIPASGKTTTSRVIKQILENEGREYIYLSSDDLRVEMFGDVNHQENNGELFNEMNKRTREALEKGINVIYDATNINRRRRIGLLQQLPKDTKKYVVYLATDYNVVLQNNEKRDRVVPKHVIDRMYKNLHIPVKGEGWDEVIYVYDLHTMSIEYHDDFIQKIKEMVLNNQGYEVMEVLADSFNIFDDIYEMPQDSTYHSFSVSRHTYYVYDYIHKNYEGEDKELMLWTALLHDIGKHFCKSFVNWKGEPTRYANFIGHDNVGAQIAAIFLYTLEYNMSFIEEVATLIQFHMYLLNENADHEKLIKLVGEDLYNKLKILREADTQAH